MESHITVCLVNFNTDDILNCNLQLLLKLNHHNHLSIIVIENTKFKYKTNFPQISYQDGISLEEAKCLPEDIRGARAGIFDAGRHHGIAMDRVISSIEDGYLLILDPDFLVLQDLSILINATDIIGAPFGKKSQHTNLQKHMYGIFPMCPMSFFCLINRNTVKETINLDYHQTSKEYYSVHNKENLIDTFYPFRQKMHKYRWEAFQTCIYRDCSICRVFIPPQLFNVGRPLERYFYKNYLIGLHLHMRKYIHNTLLNCEDLYNISRPVVYHPQSNFLLE